MSTPDPTQSQVTPPAQGATAAKSYQPYVDAKWGLKNHWYPALFSHELEEGAFGSTKICGEPILLRRENNQLYALEDRCCHRGVPLSKKPYCFKEGMVTCWYHGYTYGLNDGELKTILAAPDDPLIGNASIKTYPIVEKYSIIWVFVGDADYAPIPPLESDLPPQESKDYAHYSPNLTDDDAIVLGIRRKGESNWRLAVENGFDPGHVLIHWKSPLVYAHDLAIPLGFKPTSDGAVKAFEDPDGPKGMMNMYPPDADGHSHYEPIFENTMLNVRTVGGTPALGLRTSMWLPGVLKVENFPFPGITAHEMYVPIDDKSYEYWELLVKTAPTKTERDEFTDQYENYLRDAVFHDFNDDDLWARDSMQPFYENDVGFAEEKLCAMDAVIVAWRKLVARHARGIQTPPMELGTKRRR